MAHYGHEAAAETSADARQRAIRAFAWGVISDALITAVLVLQVAVASDVHWTAGYWKAIGLLLAKTLVQSLVTAVARRVVPPKV